MVGFTTAANRQRIEGFLRRGVRAGYRRADEPTAAQLVENSDDNLFHRVQYMRATFCSHCFPIVVLTGMHCAIDDIAVSINSLTDSNFITRDNFLSILIDIYFTLRV